MSTTVKYKNNIIVSLDGETKILATRGKWVENDIEIISNGKICVLDVKGAIQAVLLKN